MNERLTKAPFTRLSDIDGIDIVKISREVNGGFEDTCMIYCKDLESARKLRTELIKSIELLNFYIDQVEETGEIRYVR